MVALGNFVFAPGENLLVEKLMNKAALLTASALGNLCDDHAHRISCVAAAVAQLAEIDEHLMLYAAEEDRCGIDHTGDTEELFEHAGRIIDGISPVLGAEIFLYYNDEVDDESPGRLRMEIPGTSWDANCPLMFH
jgi:hypothetical protein